MSRLPVNEIITGDCLDILKGLPDESVDLILTDPPYGLNFNNGDLAHNREKVFGGDVEKMKPRPIINDGQNANELFDKFTKEANRILKKGACCCCCCCGGGGPKPLFAEWTLILDKNIGFKQAVVWDKGGLGMGIHYRRNYEFMLVAQKPGAPCIWNGGNNTPNIVKIPKIIPTAKQHPTPKPIELMMYFIRLHSDKRDIVLDPFCGHAPTCVAAKQLGRKYIGIEISAEYADIARRRLRSTEEPLF